MAATGAGVMVLRGFRRRCGRCGAKGIFRTFYRLRDRCPRCGYRFVREEGAFTGVMLVNIVLTFSLVFLSLFAYVVWRGITGDEIPFTPFVVACLFFAVFTPALFYPFATSGWAAFDLATRPLDPDEVADAARHASAPI
jgi:uncharacterized protein (DUF983 family)